MVIRVYWNRRGNHRTGTLYVRCWACPWCFRSCQRFKTDSFNRIRTSAHRRGSPDFRTTSWSCRLPSLPHQPCSRNGCRRQRRQIWKSGCLQRNRSRTGADRKRIKPERCPRNFNIPGIRRSQRYVWNRYSGNGRIRRPLGEWIGNRRYLSQ